jgi:hypothetical protein
MKKPACINSFCYLARLSLAVVLAVTFTLVATFACHANYLGNTTAAVQDDDDSGGWVFDNSTYTNDPKTGKRVDQYKKEKTPYRDPNAFFDSPLLGGFFNNDYFGGFYDNYNPLTYLSTISELYGNYFYGNDSDKYYPYDGDPNEEENLDQ